MELLNWGNPFDGKYKKSQVKLFNKTLITNKDFRRH